MPSEDRLDSLREDGATFAEQFRGRRREDTCSNCRFWVRRVTPWAWSRLARICEVWLVEQRGGGYCNRHERVR